MTTTDEIVSATDPSTAGRHEHNRGDRLIIFLSNGFAWLFPLLMIAICTQVVLRSAGFNQAWLDDLQWWLYGSASLIAIGYAVTVGSHVRVDIFYDRFEPETKYRIEIVALVWLFLPFVILSWDTTLPYAIQSFSNDEGSDSPNGLHNLWLLKWFMNIAFLFIGVATWSAYVRFLGKLTRPALWKQLLVALPSTLFIMNLAAYYGIWWFMRLTSPAELSNREISRLPVFGTFQIGPETMKWTVLAGIILTIVLIVGARIFAGRRQVPG